MNDGPLDLPLATLQWAATPDSVALAQPQRKVILFDPGSDILMSLGMLVTIAEQKPANLYHFFLDNAVYATSGGQSVPNVENVDYVGRKS